MALGWAWPVRTIAGLVFLLVALWLGRCDRKGPGVHRTRVRAHPLARTITVPGVLEADHPFRAIAPLPTTLVHIVPEGTHVKAGDFVARLDARERERDLREARRNRDSAKLELAIKELDLTLEEFEVQNRLAALERGVDTAVLAKELDDRAIDVPEYVRVSQSIEASTVKGRFLRKAIDEAKPYTARGLVSREETDTLELQAATERISGQDLSAQASIVTSGTKPDKRAEGTKAVTVARDALEAARVKLASFRRRREDARRELTAKVQSFDQKAEELQAQVGRSTIVSPIEGVVLYQLISKDDGEQMQKPRDGCHVEFGECFAQVVKPGGVKVELELDETEVARVSSDQPVTFRVGAYPGLAFRGRIQKLKPTVTEDRLAKWVYPPIHKVMAEARVDSVDARLLPGMTADVEILVESRPRALWIDVAALDGGQVTLRDGTRRAVETGYVKDQEIEVRRGLEEGDTLIVPSDEVEERPPDLVSVPVALKDLTLTLEDEGTLVAQERFDIFLEDLEGQPVLQMMAADGASVKKGEEIARLDTEAAQNKLKEASLQLSVARKDAQVTQEKAQAELDGFIQAAEVADLDLKVATLEDALLRMGKRPREIEDLSRDLQSAQEDIALVTRKLDVQEKLARQGFAKQKDVQDLKKSLLDQSIALFVAKAKFSLARQGANPLERQKSASNLRKAQLDAELAHRRVECSRKKHDLERAKAELPVQEDQAEVDRLQGIIAACSVKSPATGTVTRNERWGNDGLRKYKEGDPIWEGTVFMQVSNLDRFKIEGSVPEEKVNSVATRQRVRFHLTSFPDETYPGRVSLVGRVARQKQLRDWLADDDARIFDVEIATSETRRRFQPGLSVKFALDVATLRQVLVIPIKALHYDAQGAFVFMASGERRRITPGDEQSGEVSVTAGLSKGDEVLVARDH